jgi:hypothetical protein
MFVAVTSWRCCDCPIKVLKRYTQNGSEDYTHIMFMCPKCSSTSYQTHLKRDKVIVFTRELVEFISCL